MRQRNEPDGFLQGGGQPIPSSPSGATQNELFSVRLNTDGLNEDTKRLGWMSLFMVIMLGIYTCGTLGMVVLGFHITRDMHLKTRDGELTLTEESSGKGIHMSYALFDSDLHSSRPDTFFNKLLHVTLDISEPLSQVNLDGNLTSNATSSSGRRLNFFGGADPDEGLKEAREYLEKKRSMKGVVKGHMRQPCQNCRSGSEVVLFTDFGKLLLRDNAQIPELNEEYQKKMNLMALQKAVAAAQIANGVSQDLFPAELLLDSSTKGSKRHLLDSKNYYSISVGDSFGSNAGDNLHVNADVGVDYRDNKQTFSASAGATYNADTHDTGVHVGVSWRW